MIWIIDAAVIILLFYLLRNVLTKNIAKRIVFVMAVLVVNFLICTIIYTEILGHSSIILSGGNGKYDINYELAVPSVIILLCSILGLIICLGNEIKEHKDNIRRIKAEWERIDKDEVNLKDE